MKGKPAVSVLFIAAILVSISQAWSQDVPAAQLGPNAPEKNRETLSAFLRDAAINELQGKTFSASGKDEARIRETIPIRKKIKLPFGKSITIDEKIEIDKKLGDVEATATASFVDPAKQLKVTIPELRRKSDLVVRGKCEASCPFHGKVNAKALGIPINVSFAAMATLNATADIAFSAAKNNKVAIKPRFVDWKGRVTEVKFDDEIADAILSKLATKLVNEWLDRNKSRLTDVAHKSLQRAADAGRLTADPDDLFK